MADRPLFIRLSLPGGLEDTLEGLAREVLRNKPKNIYEFAADYFEELLRKRNEVQGLPADDIYGVQIDAGIGNGKIGDEDGTELESISGRESVSGLDGQDVDWADPECDLAATKIQAGFRGSKARKEVSEMKKRNLETKEMEENGSHRKAIEIQMPLGEEEEYLDEDDADETNVDEKEIQDIDLEDPELAFAATKIQAGYRGMKTRKDTRQLKKERAHQGSPEETVEIAETAENIDIDMNDPDVEMAATKIQAGYKGMRTRKEMKQRKRQLEEENVEEELEKETISDINMEDPETEAAATKIQAGYKGMKARKKVKKMKEDKIENDQHNEEEIEKEKEIDIDLEDPDVEAAATKIQAGYKGMQARRQVKKMKEEQNEEEETNEALDVIDINLEDPEVEFAATKIQAGYKGMQARKQVKKMKEEQLENVVNEEESEVEIENNIDIDLEDPEVKAAATTIQAGYKGMQARKQVKKMKDDQLMVVQQEKQITNEEEIDIDLDDPEVEFAATKIQAGYKGMQARKQVKKMKADNQNVEAEVEFEEKNTEEIDIDLEDPDVEAAATKIQAGYKGMQARKQVRKMKDDNQNAELEVKLKIENNEEFDIDLEDPDMEAAATKIQAGYKGMQARKQVKKMREDEPTEKISETDAQESEGQEIDIDLDDPEVELAATKIQAGYKGMQARKQVKQMRHDNQNTESEVKLEDENKEEIDIDMEDPNVEAAATKIQAGYKGMQARKQVKKMREQEPTDVMPENEETAPEEEEIDINLDDPEVEQAATKIQASYKGMQARKKVKKMKEEKILDNEITQTEVEANQSFDGADINLDDPEYEAAATKIQAGYKGMKARKQVKKMKEDKIEDVEHSEEVIENENEEEIDIDLEDPDVEAAATKIQAGYKGMQARRQVKKMKEEQNEEEEEETNAERLDVIDINLEDPEVEFAATKIQAGYKGMQARKQVKKMKEEQLETVVNEEQCEVEIENLIDIDLEDPEVEAAATKIQAGYKGMQARKQVKKMREDLPEDANEAIVESEIPEIDMDLDDPEFEQAATKIQAGYKGMKARKQVKKMKEETKAPDLEEECDEKGDEKIDIDLEDPDVELAATKIQAGYKGMQARKQVKKMKEDQTNDKMSETEEHEEQEGVLDINLEDPEIELAATKIQAGYKGMQARKQVKKMKEDKIVVNEDEVVEKEEIDIDMDDPDVEAAATKIQAGYKGMQARKQVKKMKEVPKVEEVIEAEEEIDIDLDDPEVEAAANKIQASFKGMQTRKKMRKEKEEKQNNKNGEEMTIENDEADEISELKSQLSKYDSAMPSDEEVAATKIQAGFRGMKVRRKSKLSKYDSAMPTEKEIAATKIQAGFRGMKVRRQMKSDCMQEIIEEEEEPEEEEESPSDEPEEETAVEEPEDDQEMEKAATKIQAGYRGMRTRKELKKGDNDLPGEEEATELMFEGGAQAPEDDENVRSQLDDGYISPENATWKSSNTAYVQNSSPSSICSSPTKHVESSLSAAMAGNSLNLSLNPGNGYDFDDDDTPRSILIEEQDIFEGGYEVFKLEEDTKESMSHIDETDTEMTVIADVRAFVDNANQDVEAPIEEFSDEEGANQTQPPSLSSHILEDEAVVDNVEDEAVGENIESGAIPFELHPSYNNPLSDHEEEDDEKDDKKSKEKSEESNFGLVEENVTKSEECQNVEEDEDDLQITIYHSPGSYNSEKVLIYLKERGITFKEAEVNLKTNQQLSRWYLRINPRGEVPSMSIRDPSVPSKSPNSLKIITDSTRIIHTLESRVPIDLHHQLVPCTSDTVAYQKHVYYTALLDEIPLNIITHGLAFHPELSSDPQAPYVPDAFPIIREMVQQRASVLLEAAETNDPGDEIALFELRAKAKSHEEAMSKYTELEQYEELLNQTDETLEKIENELSSNLMSDSNDECEIWVLGSTFSAIDIALGVLLNRLALLGFGQRFWGQRSFLRKFVQQIQRRPFFVQSVGRVGLGRTSTGAVQVDLALTTFDLGGGAVDPESLTSDVIGEFVAQDDQADNVDESKGEEKEEETPEDSKDEPTGEVNEETNEETEEAETGNGAQPEIVDPEPGAKMDPPSFVTEVEVHAEDTEESEEAKQKRLRELEIADYILSLGRTSTETGPDATEVDAKTASDDREPSQESLDIVDTLTQPILDDEGHEEGQDEVHEETDAFHEEVSPKNHLTPEPNRVASSGDELLTPTSEKKRTWSSLWVSEEVVEEAANQERTWDSLWK